MIRYCCYHKIEIICFFLFCSSTLHVSDGLSVHHEESKTVHTASGVCQTDSADCLLASIQHIRCQLLHISAQSTIIREFINNKVAQVQLKIRKPFAHISIIRIKIRVTLKRYIIHRQYIDMIYVTAIGQPPGGSSTVHIYTQTIHRTTQNKQYIEQHKKYIEQHNNQEECGPCHVFAGFTLASALQLRKNHGKTSVRVVIHKHTVIQ